MDSRLHWSGARRLGAFLFDIVIVLRFSGNKEIAPKLQSLSSACKKQRVTAEIRVSEITVSGRGSASAN